MIIYVNDYDVGIEALPTPTITLLLLLMESEIISSSYIDFLFNKIDILIFSSDNLVCSYNITSYTSKKCSVGIWQAFNLLL